MYETGNSEKWYYEIHIQAGVLAQSLAKILGSTDISDKNQKLVNHKDDELANFIESIKSVVLAIGPYIIGVMTALFVFLLELCFI